MTLIVDPIRLATTSANVLLAWPDFSDAATLTSSTVEAGTALAYLQLPQPSDCLGLDLAGAPLYVEADRGARAPWTLVWLGFTNATSAATWRVRSGWTAAAARGQTAPNRVVTSGDGVLTGGATYASAGLLPGVGALLVANASVGLGQYVRVPWDATLTAATFTWEATIAPDAIGAQGIWAQDGAGGRRQLKLDAVNHLVFDDAAGHVVTGATPILPGLATHVAVSWDVSGHALVLTVNGVVDASETVVGLTQTTGDVLLGTANDGALSFSGRLLEARYWATVRTPEELTAYMGRALTDEEVSDAAPNLLGYWPCDGFDAGDLPLWCSPDAGNWPWAHAFLWAPEGFTHQVVRIELADAANPAGALRAGRLYVANAWQPSRNFTYGNDRGFTFPNTAKETPTGQVIPTDEPPTPSFNFTLANLPQSEADEFGYELARRRGGSSDILVVRNPQDTERLMGQLAYGVLTSGFRDVNKYSGLCDQEYKLKGILP